MYTEEPKREINWGSVIKKGLIVLLIIAIILLIIWLFTRNRSNSVNVDYTNNNTNETLNSSSYSGVFIDNYRYFHDTAKEYFLVSSTLPANGKSIKYSLQDLIDKGLILPFAYKDKETCDFKSSYVLVQSNNGKYVMTTYLVCGKEMAKTTEELGCNQLCPNGNCNNNNNNNDKLVTEYQYKQSFADTETIYNCPGGYTQNGTKCTKVNTSTIPATKVVTYECRDGYVKTGSGSNTKCYKHNTESIPAEVTYNYKCPTGYDKSGSGESTRCTKNITYTVDATKKAPTYSCPSGYKLSGTTCSKTTTSTVNATESYTCSNGTLVNTKYCRTYSTKNYYDSYATYRGASYNGCSYSGSYTESCSTYSGCTKTYYKYYCSTTSYKDVAAKKSYTCPSGYKLSGSKCTKTTTATTKPIVKDNGYSCKTGKLSGSKCIITTTANANYIKSSSYYCKSGYGLSGNTCYKTTNINVEPYKNISYTCESGYDKIGTGSSSKCTYSSTSTINATKSTKTVTKYRYQWNTKTSIDGWERTGKTRTVKASSK